MFPDTIDDPYNWDLPEAYPTIYRPWRGPVMTFRPRLDDGTPDPYDDVTQIVCRPGQYYDAIT
jgi:hypothetical protein